MVYSGPFISRSLLSTSKIVSADRQNRELAPNLKEGGHCPQGDSIVNGSVFWSPIELFMCWVPKRGPYF